MQKKERHTARKNGNDGISTPFRSLSQKLEIPVPRHFPFQPNEAKEGGDRKGLGRTRLTWCVVSVWLLNTNALGGRVGAEEEEGSQN